MTLKLVLEVDTSELEPAIALLKALQDSQIHGGKIVPIPDLPVVYGSKGIAGTWKVVDTAADDLVGKTMLWEISNSDRPCEVRVLAALPEESLAGLKVYSVRKLDDNYTYYAWEDELRELSEGY